MFEAQITGNIGSDAQVRILNDREYISFSVAHRNRKDDNTTWVSVLQRKGDGDGLLNILKKGTGVYVRGDVNVSTYVGRDGATRVDITIWANKIEITKFASDEGQQGQTYQRPAAPVAQRPAAPAPVEDNEDPDLPF